MLIIWITKLGISVCNMNNINIFILTIMGFHTFLMDDFFEMHKIILGVSATFVVIYVVQPLKFGLAYIIFWGTAACCVGSHFFLIIYKKCAVLLSVCKRPYLFNFDFTFVVKLRSANCWVKSFVTEQTSV